MSATPTTTASTISPWRAGVIGLVALLAVGIGVAAGAFLLTSRSAALGTGASYVPASAAFYVELRLEPSSAQDAALREVLGRFPDIEGIDLGRPLHEQLVERIDEMLAGEGASVTWSEDVAPWFDGRVAIAVPELPAELWSGPMVDPTSPDAGVPSAAADVPAVVMLGVTDRAVAESAIERLLAEADPVPTFEETTHAGVTIHAAADEGAYALTDDQLLFAMDADAIAGALDAHEDAGGTLARADRLAAMAEHLPADWLALVAYDLTDAMAASWDQMASMAPEMSDAFDELMAATPMRGAMTLSAGADRFAVDAVGEAPTGELAPENAERGLADEVPGDALYLSEGGNIGPALAAVIRPLRDAVASTPDGEEQVRMIESALGANLEELVSWIDDGAMVAGWDGSAAYAGAVLVPSDVDAAARRLGQLATFASLAALDPSSGVSTETAEVAGTEVTTIRWEDPNAGGETMLPTPTGIAVQYAVTDDRAIVGIGEGFVARVLELDPADALGAAGRYRDAIDDLGGASNAGSTWVDLAGIRAAVEEAMGPALDELDSSGSYEADVQPWLLPLDRIVQVSRVEGDLVVQRAALLVE